MTRLAFKCCFNGLILLAFAYSPVRAGDALPQGVEPTLEMAHARGIELARLIQSRERTERVMQTVLPAIFRSRLQQQSRLVALNVTHPGLIDAMTKAGVDAAIATATAHLENRWFERGRLYASQLSESELRQAIVFYSNPVGQRFLDVYSSGAGTRDSRVHADQASSSRETLEAVADANSKSVELKLRGTDATAIDEFMRSSAGMKIQMLRSTILERNASDAQALDTEAEPQVRAAMTVAVNKYLARGSTSTRARYK